MVRQKHWSAIILVTIGMLLGSLLYSPALLAQDKSLVWERFDVDLIVNRDGTVNVQEHQTIHFTSGTFRFGYRELPISNLGHVDQWMITDSRGNQYQLSTRADEPYTFTVEDNGSRYGIRWYFPPIENTTESYTLSYTVHDGLRFYEGGDQLWWKAIYGDRDFPVLAGRVQVTVPTATEIVEWAAYINEVDARDRASAVVEANAHTIIFELLNRLAADEEFEVRVQFPHGIVQGSAPSWQQSADELQAQRDAELAYRQQWGPWATLGFGALGLLLFLGGPATLYLLWYRLGRDKPVQIVADYLPEPPDELTPGMAGTLLDESVDMEDRKSVV